MLGYLTAASGLGALAGALFLASRKSVAGLGRIIVLAAFGFGIGLILFGLSRTFWFSLPMMLITGMGMMVQMAASNTVLQTIVDETKRGRVMSLFLMAYAGMMPFGSLFGGFLADRIGASVTLECSGVILLSGRAGVLARASRNRARDQADARAAGAAGRAGARRDAAVRRRGGMLEANTAEGRTKNAPNPPSCPPAKYATPSRIVERQTQLCGLVMAPTTTPRGDILNGNEDGDEHRDEGPHCNPLSDVLHVHGPSAAVEFEPSTSDPRRTCTNRHGSSGPDSFQSVEAHHEPSPSSSLQERAYENITAESGMTTAAPNAILSIQ